MWLDEIFKEVYADAIGEILRTPENSGWPKPMVDSYYKHLHEQNEHFKKLQKLKEKRKRQRNAS